MPTLKQLTCSIEWAGSEVALKEYNTAYADGFVQTYVVIPPVSTNFSVHLKSNGYIASGLAMFVYMDGKYQCNRNRRNLKVPDGTMSRRHTEVDFRVRQKEEKLEDGSYLGKEWRFEELNIGEYLVCLIRARSVDNIPLVSSNAQQLKGLTAHGFEHLGTIEVVVLRCHADPVVVAPVIATPTPPVDPKRAVPSKQSTSSEKQVKAPEPPKPASPPSEDGGSISHLYHDIIGGLFDGACDEPEPLANIMPFGGDGGWDQPSSRRHSGQRWGYTMNNETEGVYHALGQPPASAPPSHGRQRSRSRGRAYSRFDGDWKQTADQDNQDRARSGLSQQRVSSFHSTGTNMARNGGGVLNSPARSAVNVDTTQGWGGTPVPVNSGGPAVIINVCQPPASAAGWGGAQENQARASSPVDSSATRKTPFDYGAQVGGGDHGPWENTGPRPTEFKPAPFDPGLEVVDGKWVPVVLNKNYRRVSEDQGGTGANHQRRTSHATVISNRKIPGGWSSQDNQTTNTAWAANNTHFPTPSTHWGGGGNNRPDNGGGRFYGSDSSSINNDNNNNNNNVGGWRAKSNNNNNNSTNAVDWEAQNNTNNNATTAWNNTTPGHRNHGGAQTGTWNDQQATNTPWPAYQNSPAQNSPAPCSPNSYNTSMPGAWAQPAISPPTTQAPPRQTSPQPFVHTYNVGHAQSNTAQAPPQQTSPQPFVHTYSVGPAQSNHEPRTAHSRIPSMVSAIHAHVKPYWAAWNKPPSPPPAKESNTSRKRSDASVNAYIVPEEPLYSVPEEVVAKKKTSHQVQPGPGAMYAHKVHSPRYMDSMEEPYAVFVFKYRSKGTCVPFRAQRNTLLRLTVC